VWLIFWYPYLVLRNRESVISNISHICEIYSATSQYRRFIIPTTSQNRPYVWRTECIFIYLTKERLPKIDTSEFRTSTVFLAPNDIFIIKLTSKNRHYLKSIHMEKISIVPGETMLFVEPLILSVVVIITSVIATGYLKLTCYISNVK